MSVLRHFSQCRQWPAAGWSPASGYCRRYWHKRLSAPVPPTFLPRRLLELTYHRAFLSPPGHKAADRLRNKCETLNYLSGIAFPDDVLTYEPGCARAALAELNRPDDLQIVLKASQRRYLSSGPQEIFCLSHGELGTRYLAY